MQFNLITRDYTRTVNGNKETVKAVSSVSMHVASHPEGKVRKEEADKTEVRAEAILAELCAAHSTDKAGLIELNAEGSVFTATESAAYALASSLLLQCVKLRTVTLSGSALNLALQGVGPNARFITNALRKSVRDFLLLDVVD